jgi:hypothetical protein
MKEKITRVRCDNMTSSALNGVKLVRRAKIRSIRR